MKKKRRKIEFPLNYTLSFCLPLHAWHQSKKTAFDAQQRRNIQVNKFQAHRRLFSFRFYTVCIAAPQHHAVIVLFGQNTRSTQIKCFHVIRNPNDRNVMRRQIDFFLFHFQFRDATRSVVWSFVRSVGPSIAIVRTYIRPLFVEVEFTISAVAGSRIQAGGKAPHRRQNQ